METSDSEIKEEDTACGNKLHRSKPADGFSRETDAKFEFETLGNQHREALATEGCSQDSDIKLEAETHCNHGNQHCETGSRQCWCQRELTAEGGGRQSDTGAELSVKQERDNSTYFVELADAAHSATTTSTDSHRCCCHGDGGGCHCDKSELCSCCDSHEVKSEGPSTDVEPKVESSENSSLACSPQETESLPRDSSQPDIMPSKKGTIIKTLMSKRKEVSRNTEPCSAENQQAMGPASIVLPSDREIRLYDTQRQGHLVGRKTDGTASLGGKGQERMIVRVITAEAESGDLQPISLTSVQTKSSQLTALNKAASHQGLDTQRLTGICTPTATDETCPLPASTLLTSLQRRTGQDSQLTASNISASCPNQDMLTVTGTGTPVATDLPQPSPAAEGGSHHEGRRLRSSAKKVPPPNIAETPLTKKESSGQAGGAKPLLIPLLPKPAHRSGGQPTGLSIPLLYLPSHLAPDGQTAVVHGVDTQVTVRLERMPSDQPDQKHRELSLKSRVQSALNARRKYMHMAKRRQRLVKSKEVKSRDTDTERASASANRQRVFKCQHCPKVCTSRLAFLHHSKVHNRDGPVKCPLCTATFTDVKSLKEHMRTSHPGRSLMKEKKVFRCQHCSKVCTQKLAFVSHSKIHNRDGAAKCQLCTASFANKHALKGHMRETHPDRCYAKEKEVFRCQHCPKVCTQRLAFVHHSIIHNRDGPVKCDLCTATFYTKHCLREHKRTTHTTVTTLAATISSSPNTSVIHNRQEPVSCNLCSATFPNHHLMRTHLSRVHGYGRRVKSRSRSGHTRRGDHYPGGDLSVDSVELDSSDEETDAGDWASDDESCSQVISDPEGSTLTETAKKTGSALTDTARKTYSAENLYVCCVCDAAFHTLGDMQRHCLEFRHNMGARCGRCSTLYAAKHVARLEVHLQLYCQQKGAPRDGGRASTCVAGSLDTVGQQTVGPREGLSLGDSATSSDGTSRCLVSVDRPSVPACHSSNVTAPLMQPTGTLTLSLPEGDVTASVAPKTASGPIQQFGTLRLEPGGDSFPSDVVLERQRDYKCPHCPRICPNKTGLVQHIAIHKRGGAVKCGLCSATFISDRCRKKHLKSVHRISRRYLTVNSISMRYLLGSSSPGIDTDSTEATDLVGSGQGGDTADGPTHSDVREMTGKDRDLHMTSSDLDVAPVSGKKSVQNSDSNGIPFSTDTGSGTSRENVESLEGSIRREMKSTGRVRLCCDQCPWKFLREYRYHLHMVSHLRHEEIERYIFVCPFCKEARFKTERAVDYHVDNRWCGVVKAILKMTKQMPRVPENIEVMCSACRGVYSSLKAYSEHAKGTGCSKRAFRCASCMKSYVYNSSLLAHRRLCHPDTATGTASATAASQSTARDEDEAEGNGMGSQHQSEQSMIEEEMQSSDSSSMNGGDEDRLPRNVTASQHQRTESTSALSGRERQSRDSTGDEDKLPANVTASQQRHEGSTMTQSARETQSREIASMLSESVMNTAGEEKSMSAMLSGCERYAGQTSQDSDGMHAACEEVEDNGEQSLSEGDDGDGGLVLECETEPGSPTESLFSTGTAQDETEIWSRAGQEPTHQDSSSDEGGEPLAGEAQHRDNDLQVSKPGVKGSATVPRRKRHTAGAHSKALGSLDGDATDDDEDDDDRKKEDDDDAIESSKSSPVKRRRKGVQSPSGKRQRGEDDDWLPDSEDVEPDKSRSQGGHGKAKADLRQPGSRSQSHKAGANPYPPPPVLVQRPTLFVCAPGSGPLTLLPRPPPAIRPSPAIRPPPAIRPSPAIRPPPAIQPPPAIRPPPSIQPTSVTRFPVYLLQNQLVAQTPIPTQNLVSGRKPFNVLNPPGSRSLLATQNTGLTLNTPASQSSFTVQSPVTVIRQPVAQNPCVVLSPLTVQSPTSVQSQPVLHSPQMVQNQPHPRSLLRRGKKSRPKYM